MTQKKIDKQKIFFAVVAIFFFFFVWWFVTTFTNAKETTPTPFSVINLLFASFIEPIGKYTVFGHLWISLTRVVIGFSVGTICGIIIGILMGTSDCGNAIIRPVFELLRPIPPIAWIPIIIMFFGVSEISKYCIVFIGSFINVTLNSYTAAKNVDLELIGAGRMLGTDKKGIFMRVILPSCTPQIFAGMQVALSTGWMGVVAAEMIGAQEGCGWMIIRGNDTLNMELVMVGMVVVGLVGFVLSTIMREIEGKVCTWNKTGV